MKCILYIFRKKKPHADSNRGGGSSLIDRAFFIYVYWKEGLPMRGCLLCINPTYPCAHPHTPHNYSYSFYRLFLFIICDLSLPDQFDVPTSFTVPYFGTIPPFVVQIVIMIRSSPTWVVREMRTNVKSPTPCFSHNWRIFFLLLPSFFFYFLRSQK